MTRPLLSALAVAARAVLVLALGHLVAPLTLLELRQLIPSEVDEFDLAGCGCATEYETSPTTPTRGSTPSTGDRL